MTTGGTVATVATLTGYKAKSLAQFDHNLYVAPFEGNILKITTAGVVSVWTTNASDLIWNSIETVNDTMMVFSKSRTTSLDATEGVLYTSGEGDIILENLALDGSDNINGLVFIITAGGKLAMTNVVEYAVICDSFVEAKDSILDEGVLVFATGSALTNCIKSSSTTTDNKRYFYDNTAFKTVYLTENKKPTADAAYDNLLATDADGKVVNGVDVKLRTVETDALMINTMLNVSTKVVSDLNYTVSNDDPILIAFTATTDQVIVTLPATVPDDKPKFRILVRANDSNYYFSINAAETWLGGTVGPARLPYLIAGGFFNNKTMAFCYHINGKWAIC